MADSLLEKAIKIKGYGSYNNDIEYDDKFIDKIQSVKTLKSGLKVQPKIINNLTEYISFILLLNTSYENPLFFRGQTNANYLLNPSSLRVNPDNEHRMIEAFSRRFSDDIAGCNGTMAKLVLMQHFGLGTRCLDITENPLSALYFACQPMKKFKKKESDDENDKWGEVIIFREPNEKNESRPEKLKTIESSNVSVMANTAFMERTFSLWQLGARWKNDVNQGHDERYIDLKSIVRSSLIVRVPQNNPRIKNQQGAFIIVNANKLLKFSKSGKNICWKKLTEQVINAEPKNGITLEDLKKKKKFKFKLWNKKTWQIRFEKIKPYDDSNEIEIFKTDPFDISRLFYKENGVQRVVLIPPCAKKKILYELERLNITEDFVYPDMDTVANEINNQIKER